MQPSLHTVAPLLSPVKEVSTSPNDITIEIHMHDGMELGHYMGDNMKCLTSVSSCICISIVISLGKVLTSWIGERSGALCKVMGFEH